MTSRPSTISHSISQRGPRRATLCVVALSLSCLVPTVSMATPPRVAKPPGSDAASPHFRVSLLRPVSGASPFPHGCPGVTGDSDHLPGSEIEPMITVNPQHPRNVVATWQQDLGEGGRADLVAATHDGGHTWKRTPIDGTGCTGGVADIASDPWVSAGAKGSVYFGGSTAFLSTDPPAVRMVSAHSSNGGRSWSAASPLGGTTHRNDKPNIVADRTDPDRAYMVWANRDIPVVIPSRSVLRFSRTTDAASTWSKPVVVDRAPGNAIDVSSEILPLPGGDLLTVFSRVKVKADGSFASQLLVTRSKDWGRNWSLASLVTSHPLPAAVIDPETGEELDSQDLSIHSAAVSRDGDVYVAWDSSTSVARGAVKVISSQDGGRHWSVPTSLPGITTFAMEPAIAAGPGGSVGVLWYDLRRDKPGDTPLTTDVWFAHSADHGLTWQRALHVAGPFNMRTAPLQRLGEYQGLAAMGSGFAAIFTQAQPRAQHGRSDIFFARIRPCGKTRNGRGLSGFLSSSSSVNRYPGHDVPLTSAVHHSPSSGDASAMASATEVHQHSAHSSRRVGARGQSQLREDTRNVLLRRSSG
jgi:hypothetical protein